MESLFQGLPKVVTYIDDILLSGEDVEEHIKNLDMVLERLEKAGITLKREVYICFTLCGIPGHIIDKDELHPSKEKV